MMLRSRAQFSLDLNEEIAVDNFAGGGGWSEGYYRATGRHVDHAINHDNLALGMHRINHPKSVHHCEDVFDKDPLEITEGRPVGIAHFSPDCKHFSKAKGGQPLNKRIRGLVLVILRWASRVRPRVISMENVTEIETYGPLIKLFKKGKSGYYPDPIHKGRTWKAFLAILGSGINADHPDLPEILDVCDGYLSLEDAVRGLGYHIEVKHIRAYHHGAPTIRNRLYMIARCDGKPVVWPEKTHENPALFDRFPGLKLKPWNVIADKIDWTLETPSIFLTRKQAKKRGYKCKRPLAKPTLRRLATGIDRFVLKAKKPYIVSLTHQGSDNRVEPLDEPSRAITGARRGEKALVVPTLSKFHGSHRGRHDGAGRNHGLQQPLQTSDTSNRFGLISANLAVNTTDHPGSAADAPSKTVPTGGHHILTASTLVQTGYGEADGQAPRVLDLNKPGGTAVAGGAKQALAATTIVKMRGTNIGHSPDEPNHAISAGGMHHGAVAAHLTKFCTGSVGSEITDPASTITSGSHSPDTHGGAATVHGLSVAYLAQHNGGFNVTPGHEATEPISAVSSKGSQQQIVAASCACYYGTEADGQPADRPAHTVRTRDNLGAVQSTGVCPPLTTEQSAGARRVAKFLRAHGVQFEGEFATIEGYVLIDIGMRMLTAAELFAAQGFGPDYVINRAWVINPETAEVEEITLTKEQQIRMCGNSVCPDVAEALVAANVPEMSILPGRRRPVRQRRPASPAPDLSHHPALALQGV